MPINSPGSYPAGKWWALLQSTQHKTQWVLFERTHFVLSQSVHNVPRGYFVKKPFEFFHNVPNRHFEGSLRVCGKIEPHWEFIVGTLQRTHWAHFDQIVLYVAVSASHVTLSCDCGKMSVVYSSIYHINVTQLSSPHLVLQQVMSPGVCSLSCGCVSVHLSVLLEGVLQPVCLARTNHLWPRTSSSAPGNHPPPIFGVFHILHNRYWSDMGAYVTVGKRTQSPSFWAPNCPNRCPGSPSVTPSIFGDFYSYFLHISLIPGPISLIVGSFESPCSPLSFDMHIIFIGPTDHPLFQLFLFIPWSLFSGDLSSTLQPPLPLTIHPIIPWPIHYPSLAPSPSSTPRSSQLHHHHLHPYVSRSLGLLG